MNNLIESVAMLGILLTIAAYLLGVWVRRRTGIALLNPMLVALAVLISLLVITGTDYNKYRASCDIMNLLVTPATVCFAIPLYKQLDKLRSNWQAIIGGIVAGVLTSAVSVFAVAKLFSLGQEIYATLLPKSITTAIGIGIAQELGGVAAITVVAIMITGVTGNIIADVVLRTLRITEPVAVGIAIGSSSHIMGTARAVEIGEVQGAMGGLSIVVAGLLTVVVAPLFVGLIA